MSELKKPILKILNKIYEPDSMLEVKFKRYDLAIKTDKREELFCYLWEKKIP